MFVVSKLAWMALRPSVLLLLLGLAGLVLAWRGVAGRRPRGVSRLALGLMTLALGGYALIMLVPLDQFALLPLENRFPQPRDPPARVAGIVVLGGAVARDLTEARGRPALNGEAERMTEFVALARRYPTARLAFTGGMGELGASGGMTEAAVARQLFDELGLADRHVIYEDRSRNTAENADFLAALIHPQPAETWILITSASHMPRAVGVFRHAGWHVLPWPVAYKTGWSLGIFYRSGLGGKLDTLDWALHEYVGLAAYRLLGRTDTLFPAPEPPAAVAGGSGAAMQVMVRQP
jgi:uncharacterized SAM-binding protein YcdF (DUF218 family)